MSIPIAFQARLDRARRRQNILALGFREVDMTRRVPGANIHSQYSDVYFALLPDGTIKIGSSRNPRHRASVQKARLLAVIPGVGTGFEAFIHHYFEGFRIPGPGERFEAGAPIWRFVGHVHRVFAADRQVAS